MIDLIASLIVSFLTSFLAIRFGKPLAERFGLVDAPNARKTHNGSIPLVGGIAIFLGVILAILIFMPQSQVINLYLIAAALIVFVGVLDDYYDLPVKPRIFAQALVACIMIFGANLYISNLGNIVGTGNIHLGILGTLFTVVAVIGAINAFNMVDGIDGLAGMLSVITFSALAFLLIVVESHWLAIPAVFISATIAYLMFNLQWPLIKLNKIFMGDAGSMLIGFTVVWLLVVGTQSAEPAFQPITALWLIAVPLMDMAAIMLRRIKKGQSPFKPDRDHLHHIFLRAGCSSNKTLLFISSIAIIFTIIGITLEFLGVPEWISLSLFCMFFVVYMILINYIWRLLTFFRKK